MLSWIFYRGSALIRCIKAINAGHLGCKFSVTFLDLKIMIIYQQDPVFRNISSWLKK
jgi:hypothetical protein